MKPGSNTLDPLLDRLGELKTSFGSRDSRNVEQILPRISRKKIDDAETLIRLHELLLFLSAYPPNGRVRRLAEALLKNFTKRIEALRAAEADLSPLESPEVSGIAGTSVTDTFSYPIVCWLVRRQPGRVRLDWEWFEDENRLAETWPRFMPLLEEDAFVEANVPYKTWLRMAMGRNARDVDWLVERFESLKISDRERTELYDSLKLYVRWAPPDRATRTGLRLRTSRSTKVFYHREPLIRRRDISLKRELENPPPEMTRLSPKQGEAILDMAREASTVRYRELYGFTHGDPRKVIQTNLGRGVDIFVMGLPPNRRLPLRAYHAAMIFKNGVPIGYFEGLSLFERMESGFNLYYTFRDGETAWLYARTLNIFRHLLGVTAFSLDPYQIGFENEEGIESGAFWFYRKLGFRPTKPEVMKLVLNEEKKLRSRPAYRTSARTLRRLAAGSMIYELDKSLHESSGRSGHGDWDQFQVRNIGFRVQRRMAERFKGDAGRMRSETVKDLTRTLGLSMNLRNEFEISALSDFAVTLSLVEDLQRWNADEKQALAEIVRAKAGTEESKYLRLTQKHERLRAALIKLGSC
ncbi:MAG: hypothetical protein M3R69_00120 [Acidobacteriota bacterium]|nr:hypothetical protein [Acidobacteriota bacterium]